MRRLLVAVAACALLPSASSEAAYAPKVELSLSTYTAGAAPAVSSRVTIPSGDETTRVIAARFPPGFTYNPDFAVSGCRGAELAASDCPADSRLGKTSVVTALGAGEGDVYLTEDFRIFAHIKAYGGVFSFRIFGAIRALDDGTAEFALEELPSYPMTEATLMLEGGPRAIFINPRRCGTYTVGSRFQSHNGSQSIASFPLAITGCPAELALTRLRVSPARVAAGGSSRLTWRLSEAARVEVTLHRFRDSEWQLAGVRTLSGRAGAGSLTVGPRWRGRRLARGRYRLTLRAYGSGASVSRARSAGFSVS